MECAQQQCQTYNLPDEHRQSPHKTWILLISILVLLKGRTTSVSRPRTMALSTLPPLRLWTVPPSAMVTATLSLMEVMASAAPSISRERMHTYYLDVRNTDDTTWTGTATDRYVYGEEHSNRDVYTAEWFGDYSSLAYGIPWVLSI